MKNVQLLKLISGEEVLGTVEVKSDLYTITMPVTIIQNDNKMGFIPFMPYAQSESFDISKVNVILMVEPTAALKDHYLKSISPIEMPSSEIIV